MGSDRSRRERCRSRGPESTIIGAACGAQSRTLTRSKAVLGVLVGAVVVAVAATGVGYAAMSKTVTLSVDGKTQQVRTFGDNVGDVLKAQGIGRRPRRRRPRRRPPRSPTAATIAVKYGRPLDVKVDGTSQPLLGDRHRRSSRARPDRPARSAAPTCRRAAAPRSAAPACDLAVVTPKTAHRQARRRRSRAGPTVTALHRRRRAHGARRQGRRQRQGQARSRRDPRATATRSRFTKVRVVQRRVTEAVGVAHAASQRRHDVLRPDQDGPAPAVDGSRKVVYKVTYENGDVTARKARAAAGSVRSRSPRSSRIGTKERPAPAPTHQLRRRQQHLGPDRRVRVRRQLGDQHRQRLLRRPAVQPGHLARPTAAPAVRDQNSRERADRRRRAGRRRRRRLRRLAGVRRQPRLTTG